MISDALAGVLKRRPSLGHEADSTLRYRDDETRVWLWMAVGGAWGVTVETLDPRRRWTMVQGVQEREILSQLFPAPGVTRC